MMTDFLKQQFPNAIRRGGTRKIDTKLLHTDLSYQRNPNKKKIKHIVDNFDINALDPLVVSYRNGRYNVVDGQHRLCAIKELCKKLGWDSFKIECRIIDGLTEEDECKLFKILADRRTVSVGEKAEASYCANDKVVVEIIDCVKQAGLICDFKGSKGENKINSIESLIKIYNDLGKEDFIKYLRLIKNTWNGNSVSLQKFMLMGVFEFYKVYHLEFNEKTFITKLSKWRPDDIKSDGQSDRTSNGYAKYAKVILNKYNKSAKGTNRLNNKW